MSNKILLAFYTPDIIDSGGYVNCALNNITAWFTSHKPYNTKFSHVELIMMNIPNQLNQPFNNNSKTTQNLGSRKAPLIDDDEAIENDIEFDQTSTPLPGTPVRSPTNYITFSVQWVNKTALPFCCCQTYDEIEKNNEREENSKLHEVAVLENKSYKQRPNYQFVALSISDEQNLAIYNIIVDIVKNRSNYKFNYCGQITNFLPTPLYNLLDCTVLKLPVKQPKQKWKKVVTENVDIVLQDDNNSNNQVSTSTNDELKKINDNDEDENIHTIPNDENGGGQEESISMGDGFCSEIICKILQKGLGIIKNAIPEKTSPNDLWTELMRYCTSTDERKIKITFTVCPEDVVSL